MVGIRPCLSIHTCKLLIMYIRTDMLMMIRTGQRRQQMEADERLARQSSMESTQSLKGRAPQPQGLSEREVQRMKQLQLQGRAQSR